MLDVTYREEHLELSLETFLRGQVPWHGIKEGGQLCIGSLRGRFSSLLDGLLLRSFLLGELTLGGRSRCSFRLCAALCLRYRRRLTRMGGARLLLALLGCGLRTCRCWWLDRS